MTQFDVSFTNTGPSPLRDVRVKWEWLDAFGEQAPVVTIAGDATGPFAPGARSGFSWAAGVPGSVTQYRCSIVAAVASDGTAWKAPPFRPTPAQPIDWSMFLIMATPLKR